MLRWDTVRAYIIIIIFYILYIMKYIYAFAPSTDLFANLLYFYYYIIIIIILLYINNNNNNNNNKNEFI